MASTVSRKRPRTARKTQSKSYPRKGERYLVDENGKPVAVVLDLAEYRRLLENTQTPSQMSSAQRAELVVLAKRAKGSWRAGEGTGTAVDIVRRLRDEWDGH